MKARGETRNAVIEALRYLGPMTRVDIADAIDVSRDSLGNIMTRLSRPSKLPPGPKVVYIKEWTQTQDDRRCYPRPVYALGDKPNAKKPRSNAKALKLANDARRLRRNRANSIFNLAQTRFRL